MATTSVAQLRLSQALFVTLGVICILAALVPMGLPADAAPMPNLVFVLAVAWTIRRPSASPWGLIFVLGLLADIVLMQPIGMWTLCTLLASEFVRAQRWPIREQMFAVEWAIFATLFALALGFNALLLGLVFAPRPSFGLALNYFLSTVIAYPILVGLLYWVFQVRSPSVSTQSRQFGRIS